MDRIEFTSGECTSDHAAELELTATQVLRSVNPAPQSYPREEAAYGAQLTEEDRLTYAKVV